MTSEWLVAAPLAPWGDDLWPLPHVLPTRCAGHARRPEPESPAAGRASGRAQALAGRPADGAPGWSRQLRAVSNLTSPLAPPCQSPWAASPEVRPARQPAPAAFQTLRSALPPTPKCRGSLQERDRWKLLSDPPAGGPRLWQRLSAGPPVPVPPASPATCLSRHPHTCVRSPEAASGPAATAQRAPGAPPGPALQAAAPARADGSRPARPSARRWPPPPASCPTSSLRLGPVARGGLIISSFLEQLQAPASAY